jgi:diaminohydroxyphosphoribosylaminopyrimidine deaminase/5-amino-6-(5-phosphoribosylamino)uracil reductase
MSGLESGPISEATDENAIHENCSVQADTIQDEGWMGRALELARESVGLASPNPVVGCVVVRNGEAVGEGAHHYDDLDHAEVVALREAGEQARGATAYVTLEPCSHQGRTSPCANALIAAGVLRVVAATVDPNPMVRGEGLARLRAAGVEVEVGVLERGARELNDGFAKFMRTGRPLVTLKMAVSADVMIAPTAGVPGEIHWVTGVESRADVQRMRHEADAVLTGIGTVLADDPLLTDRSGGARRRRLLRVVVDSRLRLPVESRLAQGASEDVLVICDTEAEQVRVEILEAAGVDVVRVPGVRGRVDLGAVLDVLGERKILSVMLECGSALNGAFLRAGLVDKVVMFCSAKEMGASGVWFAAGVESVEELERQMVGVERVGSGEDVRVSGYLRSTWV